MAQQPNICKTDYKSMFDTYPERTYSLRPSMAHCMGVLVPICSSNVAREIVSSWCRNAGPITCLQDGHQRDTSWQGCRSSNPQREPRDICALATLRTFCTQEEMVIAQTPKKREVTQGPSDFFLNDSVHLK